MTAVRSDRIGIPVGLHERRVLAWLRSSAGDALAGRRVWSAASLPGSQVAGRRLRNLLKDDVEIEPLAVDAVVVDERLGIGGPERVTALVPASQLLDIREVPLGDDAARAERVALAWISLLGDIVEEDRADHVGGTIQARPVVAAR